MKGFNITIGEKTKDKSNFFWGMDFYDRAGKTDGGLKFWITDQTDEGGRDAIMTRLSLLSPLGYITIEGNDVNLQPQLKSILKQLRQIKNRPAISRYLNNQYNPLKAKVKRKMTKAKQSKLITYKSAKGFPAKHGTYCVSQLSGSKAYGFAGKRFRTSLSEQGRSLRLTARKLFIAGTFRDLLSGNFSVRKKTPVLKRLLNMDEAYWPTKIKFLSEDEVASLAYDCILFDRNMPARDGYYKYELNQEFVRLKNTFIEVWGREWLKANK